MGWKGAARTIGAAIRKAGKEQQRATRSEQREAMRRYRDLQSKLNNLGKMQEREQAEYEVRMYQAKLDVLLSVQKECGADIHWHDFKAAQSPEKPEEVQKPGRLHTNEERANQALQQYQPSLWDRLLKRSAEKRRKLELEVKIARTIDKQLFDKAMTTHIAESQERLKEWQEEVQDWEQPRKLAGRILAGDESAYVEAIESLNPFEELKELGSTLRFEIAPTVIEVGFHVHDDDVVPNEAKSLTKTGKVSSKELSAGKRMEIYQDHVCGCVVRVARETFALLPVDTCIVTAHVKSLNSQTGRNESAAILSVAFRRDATEQINWESADPSDSMKNYVHRMKFKRSVGFEPIEPIQSGDLSRS